MISASGALCGALFHLFAAKSGNDCWDKFRKFARHNAEVCIELLGHGIGIDVVGALGVHKGGLGFSVTPIVGVVDPQAELQPCPREVAEIFEVPIDFVADLSNHTIEQREHKGVKYNMYAAPFERFHIWGLTAGILRTLAETLQDGESLR